MPEAINTVSDAEILSPQSPVELLDEILGPEPMFEGEDAEAYEKLLLELTAEMQPVGILEAVVVRDLAGIIWGIQRIKAMKRDHLVAGTAKGVEKLLQLDGERCLYGDARAQDYVRGEKEAVTYVHKMIRERGMTPTIISVFSLAESMGVHEALDRMLARLEHQREKLIGHYYQRQDRKAFQKATADAIDVTVMSGGGRGS